MAADPRRPFVSVILPVHNGEEHLAAAIDSILRQTHANFELIVLDDGSTDRSAAIAAGFDDARIRLVRNERNLGIVATLNKALELARAEFVARMDADDIADPRRFEMQVARLLSDPDVALLGTGITFIDTQGRSCGAPRRPAIGPGFVRWRLLRGTCLFHPTLMINRARAAGNARYSEEFPHAEDYELCLRLSRRHRLDNLPEHLLQQRLHPGSISARHRHEQLDSAARALVEHLREEYGLRIRKGQAVAMLEPGTFLTRRVSGEDSPAALVLRLESMFRDRESGVQPADLQAVARDVAFFLWKISGVAVLDWADGAFLSRRLRVLGQCVRGLVTRPRAALAALVA